MYSNILNQHCRYDRQISEPYDHLSNQTRGFENLQNRKIRRLLGYWNVALLMASDVISWYGVDVDTVTCVQLANVSLKW